MYSYPEIIVLVESTGYIVQYGLMDNVPVCMEVSVCTIMYAIRKYRSGYIHEHTGRGRVLKEQGVSIKLMSIFSNVYRGR